MADSILMTGDMVMFIPAFSPAVIVPVPGTLAGTGRAGIGKKPVCVDGDEKNVVVPGVVYMTPSHPIPGVGILTIAALGGDQKAKKTKCGGKAVLLKGSTFDAKLQVTAPAQQPAPPGPPVPDANAEYKGKGQFITTNVQVKGT
ncbi:MAG TPA: hypothetical protein VFQ45_17845 [Longimicrobium sp.]|nr:hypothetical protein [Longimicrobium sp.]